MLLFFLFLSGALAQEALPIDILVDILLADEKYPIFFRIQYMEQRHCILKKSDGHLPHYCTLLFFDVIS